jgi:hypothetical protein
MVGRVSLNLKLQEVAPNQAYAPNPLDLRSGGSECSASHRVVIVPCRTVPMPKHNPVVSRLSLSQHGTIELLCSISAWHGTERCVLLEISTRHEADTVYEGSESRTRHEEPLEFSGTTHPRMVAESPVCRVGASARPFGVAAGQGRNRAM